jgi:hypothetical protein
MQTAQNVRGFITLIFIPIGGNDPAVTMYNNDTFDQHYPLSVPGEFVVFERLTFEFSNTITIINLALGINSTDITGDYLTNSKNAAEHLYRLDNASLPQPTPTQSPTPDPYAWFYDSWIVKTIGAVMTVITSIVGFVVIPIVAVKRKTVRRQLRKLLRIE